MPAKITSLLVLGAGSWGTALAIQFARSGIPVMLWGRDQQAIQDMQQARENRRYLPGAEFPETLNVSNELESIIADYQDILISVPSHAFRQTLETISPKLKSKARIAWATKGFELSSGKLPHQVAEEILGDAHPLAVLSGPTFAAEVGRGLPTAITVAANNDDYAEALAISLSDAQFRAYTTNDRIGVEVGGAVKNVLAIGAGLSDGLGFASNTRIALISRGLVEMTRLAVALGANADTMKGLAGMGDLVLTCTDNQSRNRQFGLKLAQGNNAKEAENAIDQVVEGVLAAKAVNKVAADLDVDMPICQEIYRILYEGLNPREAVMHLMSRALTSE